MVSTPARFGELLWQANCELDYTRARLQALPERASEATVVAAIHDVAASLNTLGRTIGTVGPATDHLTGTLQLPAKPFGQPRPEDSPPSLVRSASLIRAAAELLDTNAATRPVHISSEPARQGAWSAVAALTESLADCAAGFPTTTALAANLRAAAAAVPAATMPAGMSTVTAAPAMPVQPGSPNELASRIHEVAAIADRIAQPAPWDPPAATLIQLAAYCAAAHRAGGPADRVRQWRNITASLAAISTPMNIQPESEGYALGRATRLLADNPKAADAAQARAGTAQIGLNLRRAVATLGDRTPAYIDITRVPAHVASIITRHPQPGGMPINSAVKKAIQIILDQPSKPQPPPSRGIMQATFPTAGTTTSTLERRGRATRSNPQDRGTEPSL